MKLSELLVMMSQTIMDIAEREVIFENAMTGEKRYVSGITVYEDVLIEEIDNISYGDYVDGTIKIVGVLK